MLLCCENVERYVDVEASRWRSPAWSMCRWCIFYEVNDLESSRRNLITGIALCQQFGNGLLHLDGPTVARQITTCQRRAQKRPGYADGGGDSPKIRKSPALAVDERRRRRTTTTRETSRRPRRTLEKAAISANPIPEFETLGPCAPAAGAKPAANSGQVLNGLGNGGGQEERNGSLITVYVLQALCKQAAGNRAAALDRLGQALSLATSPGYRRVFLDEGPAVAAIPPTASCGACFRHRALASFSPRSRARPEGLAGPVNKTQFEDHRLLVSAS